MCTVVQSSNHPFFLQDETKKQVEAKDVELKQLQEQLSALQDNLLNAEQKLAEQVSLIQLWFHSRLIRSLFYRMKVLRAVHVRRKRLRLI